MYCKRSFPSRDIAGNFHPEEGIHQPQYHINPLLLLRPYIIRLLYGQDFNNVLIDVMNILNIWKIEYLLRLTAGSA